MALRRGPKPKKIASPGGALWEGFVLPNGLSEEARYEYERLVKALTQVGTIDRIDPLLVLTAARVAALIEQAIFTVERDGLTIEAGNGTLCRHPMLSTVNTLTMRLRGLWSDMGLTPATSKLGEKSAETDNPWTGLLGITG